MTYSLGEISALAVKAARGAGYPWGLAHEAGRAVRWCHAQGLDGACALETLLTHVDERPLSAFAPQLRDGSLVAPLGEACPLQFGVALSDHAQGVSDQPIEVGSLLAPLLVFPFIADAAQIAGGCFRARWDAGEAIVSADGIEMPAGPPRCRAGMIVARCHDAAPLAGCITRADAAPHVMQRLLAFAHRTYAPASEASRLRGAGDGSTTSE